MPTLPNYTHFNGRHPETGSIHNALAYQGFTAPHTAAPYSEALMLGVSGGITFGYFAFHYDGHPPQINLLTRNTFDPFPRILERLGVVQSVYHTTSAKKAAANLINALENGLAPIVWGDMARMPYNAAETLEGAIMPLIVFGVDDDTAHIADRASVPLTTSTDALAAARGSVKKYKHRLITLDAPDERKLVTAVNQGIWDCISLYTETPPPGANYKKNFGLDGIAYFADLLTTPKNRRSWAKTLHTDSDLFAALTSAVYFLLLFSKHGGGERAIYADFLDEAAIILDKDHLNAVAAQFREIAPLWDELGIRLLPDDIPALSEARILLYRRNALFITNGAATTNERRHINGQLETLRKTAKLPDDMPDRLAHLAAGLRQIHTAETQAVNALIAAMGGA